MSVDVKTPTHTLFDHQEFPCGDKTGLTQNNGTDVTITVQRQGSAATMPPSAGPRSDSRDEGGSLWHLGKQNFAMRRRRGSEKGQCGTMQTRKRAGSFSGGGRYCKKSILPSKFLLGGSITDPLNLNSMCDEHINRMLNEKTPQSSPLPVPVRPQHIEVLVPSNMTDPLNLNDSNAQLISPKGSSKKKRNKSKRKKSLISEISATEEKPADSTDPCVTLTVQNPDELPSPVSSANTSMEAQKRDINKIVSPVIPQLSPKRKRKRTSSEHRVDPLDLASGTDSERAQKTKHQSPHRPRSRFPPLPSRPPATKSKQRPKNKFIYGNYNRYYGYRNPDHDEDHRLKCIRRNWVQGKDVLDIGCNVGHVTLLLARDWQPRRIVGIDIDGALIHNARNNIRRYLSTYLTDGKEFPISMAISYGPIAAPPLLSATDMPGFPHNIVFIKENYVLSDDHLLQTVKEEYDVILAFSVTKWFHLNWGDAGIKRVFRRMFRQLRPGGKLVLEPQAWPSYKRKCKLTETIAKNYSEISLRPEQFTEYLLSKEVGFSTCEVVDVPFNKSKGFQRPIQVFTKSQPTTQNTPQCHYDTDTAPVSPTLIPDTEVRAALDATSPLSPSECGTPLFETDCSQSTTRFHIGTPESTTGCSSLTGTPSQSGTSAWTTPRTESRSATPRYYSESLSGSESFSAQATPVHGSEMDLKPDSET